MMDSMSGRSKTTEINLVRKWLNLEAIHRNVLGHEKSETSESNEAKEGGSDGLFEFDDMFTRELMPGYIVKVPRQPNSHDCGCFLLKNIFQFGHDGGFKDTSSKGILTADLKDWYAPSDGVAYRKEIAQRIGRLIAEQDKVIKSLRDKHEQAKKNKIKQRIKKRKEKEISAEKK